MTLTREARWILGCAADADPGRWENVAGLDVARILGLAREHRLAARIGRHLQSAGWSGSGAWADEMRGDWRRSLAEDALWDQELRAIAERAAERGVTLVALKGADLASRVYGPGDRPRNDLDLLVRPAQREAACSLLEEAGFACDHPRPHAAREHWFAVTFRNRVRTRVQVDLHWDLASRGRARWDVEAVVGRSEPHPLGGGLRRLAPPDLLAHLALHAVAFHGAAGRWIWWLDLRLVAPLVEPAAAAARAREVGAGVALEAAGARVATLFPPRVCDAPGSWRARAINAVAPRGERASAGRLTHWLVGALAIDDPRALGRAVWAVARRAGH